VGFEQIIHTKNNSSQKSLVQYILRKVAIHESQPFIGETDDLTIEHLLPQSSVKVGENERLIGQLGNLVLVDSKTNEMLSTNDFKHKKVILKDRGYKIPDLLESVDELDEKVIGLNTRRLSELARDKIWKV